LLLFITACDKEEEIQKEIFLEVTNIYLTDVGRVLPEFKFYAWQEDDVIKCSIRTVFIPKNSLIESINTYVKGDELTIDVVSSPYNFEWNDTEWLNDPAFSTAHDIDFSLLGLKKGIYTIHVNINAIFHVKPFRYLIDF
jgi:hypothetical protein